MQNANLLDWDAALGLSIHQGLRPVDLIYVEYEIFLEDKIVNFRQCIVLIFHCKMQFDDDGAETLQRVGLLIET
jgi:hypothetical protein